MRGVTYREALNLEGMMQHLFGDRYIYLQFLGFEEKYNWPSKQDACEVGSLLLSPGFGTKTTTILRVSRNLCTAIPDSFSHGLVIRTFSHNSPGFKKPIQQPSLTLVSFLNKDLLRIFPYFRRKQSLHLFHLRYFLWSR